MVSLPQLPFNQSHLFINNEWVESTGSATTTIENPDTGDIIATVPAGTAEDVSSAVDAAYEAFHHGPWVNEYTGSQRRDAINALATLIEQNREEIELIESINTGKPITDARLEMDDAIDILRFYAGYADKVHGRHISPQANPTFEGYTAKVPVGVVAHINSFNYPAMLWAWKVAPALAAGCTIVFKPGPQTPLTTLYFGHLIKQTGLFPPGVYNVVVGGVDVGQALVDNDKVDKVGFTGSVATGKHVIKSTASTRDVRKVSVELGGKSPVMLPKLKAAAERIALGVPQEESTVMGPLIDRRQFERVMDYIRIGKEEDKAELLTGGERAFDHGHWVQPTVFVNVDPKARIATEEIFGPVLTTLVWPAAIFSHNPREIAKFTRALRNGTIWVNTYNILFASLPFGGFRNSGFGRELGEESFEGYLEVKTIITDVTV
ncbi:aldehyde dehydrogenase [Linderina pennispora]|uniref:Aldehyde dehydrogenase n=1 Tax=Linderina pennispora TaxID=61395 RepID=A0A1Y1W0V4_9FUNG|nr:aldehyde dehydrogenase [Linderina pennispora]ORX67112.1 aldehyde dehydrogenase [Linderina pennispora]